MSDDYIPTTYGKGAAMTDVTLIVLVAGAFVGSVFNAAFSAGGALIVLAITSTFLPVQAIVPIQSSLLIGSTMTRVMFFREHIEWKITGPFLAGSMAGVLLGARVYIELTDAIIATAISFLMLVALWLPSLSWRPKIRHPWVIVGFVHTFVSTLFAYGALLHSVILHTGLKRQQIIGTMAGGLAGMGAFKIAGYALYGFDYSPYLTTIAAAFVVSFVGTAIGKRVGEKLPEEKFRLAYKVLITITALRLLYAGLIQGSP